MSNKLRRSSLLWAMKHVRAEGDTDVFPSPFEHEIIWEKKNAVLDELVNIDVSSHTWGDARRFLVQKDPVSFRSACQLDPIDTVLFASIIHSNKIRIRKRTKRYEGNVYSHRLTCDGSGMMYDDSIGWNEFWKDSIANAQAEKCTHVIVTDIVDFYNQIYHHTLENQMEEAGFPGAHMTAIKNLLQYETDKVSRGIPVGPHASHALAELSMSPIDGYLLDAGIPFTRYVDDIHIFVGSSTKATITLGKFAQVLDQHKLCLNKSKTKVYDSAAFIELCNRKLTNDPINDVERKFLKFIKDYSDNPYEEIDMDEIADEEKKELYGLAMDEVLAQYLRQSPVDYVRIGWLLRRLAQVGIPGSAEFIVNNIDNLLPVISGIVKYISNLDYGDLDDHEFGRLLLSGLKHEVVMDNEYFCSCILSSYANCPDLNHFQEIAEFYGMSAMVSRKVVLAARAQGKTDWIRQLKKQTSSADAWLKRAIYHSASILPRDEAQVWLSHSKRQNHKDFLTKLTIQNSLDSI